MPGSFFFFFKVSSEEERRQYSTNDGTVLPNIWYAHCILIFGLLIILLLFLSLVTLIFARLKGDRTGFQHGNPSPLIGLTTKRGD